ncbi:MAG: substrate-binding domain-containing protein, partial [Ruegeria sp.]
MYYFRAAAGAALFSLAIATGAMAQDITLTSHDGKIEVTGELLGFDGEFYRVKSQFGELTIDGSGVTCDGPACPSLTDYVGEVTFSGSSVMAEALLPALIKGFAQRNGLTTKVEKLGDNRFVYALLQPGRDAPLGRLAFRVANTDQGFADLISNDADIVMALREIRPAENDRTRAVGSGDLTRARRSRVLALDAMVPVVAPDNPVQQISLSNLAAVFSGEIGNWVDLGGPDAPISLYLPDEGSGLAQAVEEILGVPLASSITRHTRSSDLVQAVQADAFAIGIASYAEAQSARVLSLAGGCEYALTATRQSIKTEDYPLTSPMFLYLPNRRLPKIARQFLAYTQGPEAQMVIRQAGFVDQAPETVRLGLQGDRLANAIAAGGSEVGLEELQRMIETLRPMSRLSLSFRFEAGSSRPDAQSSSNILHLAQALES